VELFVDGNKCFAARNAIAKAKSGLMAFAQHTNIRFKMYTNCGFGPRPIHFDSMLLCSPDPNHFCNNFDV
jgi:hypothetical protein